MPDAISFEAKFYALRKSKDGLIVSFVIHPNDAPNELITAPIGEQYIVALAPFVESPSVEATTRKDEGSQLRPIEGETPASRAIKMAHTYASDRQFQNWCGTAVQIKDGKERAEDALKFIRIRCGVPSCSQFHTDKGAVSQFLAMETEYLQATGRMASPS